MPKDVPAPEPQPQYEGYRWFGADWGRSGKATPARLGGIAMTLSTLIVLGVAIRAVAQDGRALFVVVSLGVGALTAVAAAFYFVEAHFAARAAAEQEPILP